MDDEELFHLAREMPIGDRTSFLDRACADEPDRRKRVEALLRSHETPDSFLAGPAYDSGSPIGPDPNLTTDFEIGRTDERIGRRRSSVDASGSQIGPYKLLQQLGEGGMGTVYMADQSRPVRRRVAVKVIIPGMDSGQVIARFEAERQALALMDHVNIARVLDAGTTDSGRPYFVMELGHGVPITQYCDDNHLTPKERLKLFVPVCRAIQHAHQKGIIHRDIKPSNVMVTLYDGNPAPKVIDFGVAKATEQKLTEADALHPVRHAWSARLEYMSPEQAEMSALGVDTRSDIYSLGVLLYELLTGQHAADAQADQRSDLRRDPPPDQGRGAAQAEHEAERFGRGAGVDLGPSADGADQTDEGHARRTRLDRDEIPGEGPQPPIRDGRRFRGGFAALPGRRVRAGVPAVGVVSLPEVRPAEQGGADGRGAGDRGVAGGDGLGLLAGDSRESRGRHRETDHRILPTVGPLAQSGRR